jgi:hypothetical protein
MFEAEGYLCIDFASVNNADIRRILHSLHYQHIHTILPLANLHSVKQYLWLMHIYVFYCVFTWYAVAQLVEALRYKPEGRRFDSRWSHWNFSVT